MKIKEIRKRKRATWSTSWPRSRSTCLLCASQAVTEKLENPSQLGKTRKDIARIKTVLRQRELTAQKAEVKATETRRRAASNAALLKR